MHLGECVDLFSESNRFDSEVRSCVNSWLWKTKTEFHNSDDLVLNPSFGALCFSYSLGGLVMIGLKPKWTAHSKFPYVTYAMILTFVQGKKLLKNMEIEQINFILSPFVSHILMGLITRTFVIYSRLLTYD